MKRYIKSCLWAAIAIIVTLGCEKSQTVKSPDVTDTLRIGMVKNLNHLFLLAQEEGDFADEHLFVDTQYYATGDDALTALQESKVDMAVCGLGPFTQLSFSRSDIRILASLVTYRELYQVAANKASGINSPADLRYKRLAVSRGSSMHFFLDNFLMEHSLPADSIQLTYLEPQQQIDALADGTVDAICTREPYLNQAIKKLGPNLLLFRPSTLPSNVLSLTTVTGTVPPELQERLLRALLHAEQNIEDHPKKAAQTLAGVLGVPADEILRLWKEEADHSVTLSQNILLNLENVAIWQKWKAHDETPPPNYLQFIDSEALSRVKPEAVSIINEDHE